MQLWRHVFVIACVLLERIHGESPCEKYRVVKNCYAENLRKTHDLRPDAESRKKWIGFTTIARNVVEVDTFIEEINREFDAYFDKWSYSSVLAAIHYQAQDILSPDPETFVQNADIGEMIHVPVSKQMSAYLRQQRNTSLFTMQCHVNVEMKYYGAPQVCIETLTIQNERGENLVSIINNTPTIWFTLKSPISNNIRTDRVKKPKVRVMDCVPAPAFAFNPSEYSRIKPNSYVTLEYVHPQGLAFERDDKEEGSAASRLDLALLLSMLLGYQIIFN